MVGKSISLGNEAYTVVGILGKEFRSDPAADLWVPFQFPPVSFDGNHYFRVAGLLRPGVTLAQANAQLALAAVRVTTTIIRGAILCSSSMFSPCVTRLWAMCVIRSWFCWAQSAWCC